MNSGKKSKSLKYVETYDKINKLIKEQNLQPGQTIPSEHQLVELFGVSRGTVRQAIALLKEDGIIYNQQGVGNILIDLGRDKKGLEQVNRPIFMFNNVEYTKVELNTEFQPASDKMKEFLQKDGNYIVMLINVKYYIHNEIVALLMYFIDYENVKEYNLNLETEEELKSIIDDFISRKVVKSELSFQAFKARSAIAQKMNITTGDFIIYFSEVMKKADDSVAFYRRAYFNPNYFTFSLTRV